MDRINKKVCQLAENLLVKGEFLSWRRFSFSPQSIPDIEIAPICNKQSDRIVVEKIITTNIVDSHPGRDASTIYLVEVLATVSNVSSLEENELTIVTSDSLSSYEQSIAFTICHNSDESFTLLDVMF
jgi:PBP1b-binding outer membrane lipoprotein LpoB